MDDKPTYDELAAHVERLRDAMHYVLQAWNYEGVLAEHGSTFQEADNRLTETPAQSLNHIKAQVEEETIERHIEQIRSKIESASYDMVKDALEYIAELFEVQPSKYKENLMEIKVSDLEGEQLAEWAARAQGWNKLESSWISGEKHQSYMCSIDEYRPDINPEQAMWLLKRFCLGVEGGSAWGWKNGLCFGAIGNTEEQAITRAAIASVYGETVTVEDE